MTINSPPTTHRITEFHHWQKEGILELAPPFQRNPVWSSKNKSYLIDTILNGFPVPEIFIQVVTDHDGNTKYVVVDGQQRIRTILEFVEGEWAILESESPRYGSKLFKDIPQEVRKEFWDYQIVTREIKAVSETDVVAIFTRMNKYVTPLNAQELRNARYRGHFIQLMDSLTEDEFLVDNKIVSPTDVRRMLDMEFVSEIVIAMLHGVQQKNVELIDKFYGIYDEEFTEKDDIKSKFNVIKNKINEIMGDLRPTRWHHKAEFYGLFLALDQLLDEYVIMSNRYEDIKGRLTSFSNEVDKAYKNKDKKDLDNNLVNFLETVKLHTTDREGRSKRIQIIRELLIPFLIAKDARRGFNEEERRIAWSLLDYKICSICNEKILDWNDYHLDHKIPHSKGGKTELQNASPAHKKCNIKKSNKQSK
jgi:hypothetical protein